MAETLRNGGGTSGAEQPQNSPGFSDSAPEGLPLSGDPCLIEECLPHTGVLPIPDGTRRATRGKPPARPYVAS